VDQRSNPPLSIALPQKEPLQAEAALFCWRHCPNRSAGKKDPSMSSRDISKTVAWTSLMDMFLMQTFRPSLQVKQYPVWRSVWYTVIFERLSTCCLGAGRTAVASLLCQTSFVWPRYKFKQPSCRILFRNSIHFDYGWSNRRCQVHYCSTYNLWRVPCEVGHVGAKYLWQPATYYWGIRSQNNRP
jgi:hypothetical protein